MSVAESQAKLANDLVPSGQLVTFVLDGVEFGIDIDRVQEITPRTDICPVPGAPSFILGVINLRGMIIPVIDSRRRFHLPEAEPTARTRIIVMDLAGEPTGLQVDAVSEVVRLDDFTLRETPPLVAGVQAEYLAGMVTVGKRLITLIHLAKLLDSSEFQERDALRADAMAASGLFGMDMEGRDEEISEDRAFVTFSLGGESFGIALEQVEEILEIPAVTKVPDAPDYVLGVICLREQVLPLVDLTAVLAVQGLQEERQSEMVVLVSFGETAIGIVVDRIQEILRVTPDKLLPAPQTLSETEAEHLEGVILRGERMVGLLNVMRIITGDDQAKISALGQGLGLRDSKAMEVEEKEDLVVFQLGAERYAMKLQEVREIIMVGQITPVPRAPQFVEGVLNLRGEVMPVVDLRTRFGLERLERNRLSRILICSIGGVYTGLVVDAVDEVRPVERRAFEDPPRLSAAAGNRYIEKVARVGEGMIFLLQVRDLLTDAETQSLQGLQGASRKG
ncbi:MAG TPA: chemotaxis protein CheW [Holophagaceae bacterium]|nr:chemotaxis protein CheW [Holophagaceae bacterium]HJW33106.1 chemotaxis protein CheW [Holophagaceae bacterium]